MTVGILIHIVVRRLPGSCVLMSAAGLANAGPTRQCTLDDSSGAIDQNAPGGQAPSIVTTCDTSAHRISWSSTVSNDDVGSWLVLSTAGNSKGTPDEPTIPYGDAADGHALSIACR